MRQNCCRADTKHMPMLLMHEWQSTTAAYWHGYLDQLTHNRRAWPHEQGVGRVGAMHS